MKIIKAFSVLFALVLISSIVTADEKSKEENTAVVDGATKETNPVTGDAAEQGSTADVNYPDRYGWGGRGGGWGGGRGGGGWGGGRGGGGWGGGSEEAEVNPDGYGYGGGGWGGRGGGWGGRGGGWGGRGGGWGGRGGEWGGRGGGWGGRGGGWGGGGT